MRDLTGIILAIAILTIALYIFTRSSLDMDAFTAAAVRAFAH